ncbi:hypothetical protein [Chloroflexus sp.]|uniref:hypothetical protein n=1 Tax=Chloroflexus sp. TaxID=1904827 RepID=UPI002ACD5573|nr:hypothetical protein [Chloroflexus sp.]
MRSFELSKKKGKEHWVEPIVVRKEEIENSGEPAVRFTVQHGSGKPPEGTVGRRGARCLCCDTPVRLEYIRDEGKSGRMAAQMMAIVAEGRGGRIYLLPTGEHEQVAARHRDLFTPRQLVALTTFSDLVGEARALVRRDAERAGVVPDPAAYADAVATYLAIDWDWHQVNAYAHACGLPFHPSYAA